MAISGIQKGANRVTTITEGHNYVVGKPQSAFIKTWQRSSDDCKSARIVKPGSGIGPGLVKIVDADKNANDKLPLKGKWWVLNGVELPGNTHIREFKGKPVDAVQLGNGGLAIHTYDLFVAKTLGTPVLSVCTTAGVTNNADGNIAVEAGQLVWGQPGAGSFTGTGATAVIRAILETDITIEYLKTSGVSPHVIFVVN